MLARRRRRRNCPGCMSAWKKPSRSAWRRNALDQLRGRASGGSKPRLASARGIGERDAVDPFHRQHFAGRAVPVDLRARGNRGRRLRFSANSDGCRRLEAKIHFHRAPSAPASRRLRPGAAAAPRRRSARRAARRRTCRRDRVRNAARRPGRSTLTATSRSPLRVATSARCTWAIEAAATASPNSTNTSSIGAPNAASTRATATSRGHGAMRSCRLSSSRGDLGADDVGAGRQKLAELDVGRPEPIDGGGESRRAPLHVRAARTVWRCASGARAGGGSARADRCSTNTPSRASTKPARARRTRGQKTSAWPKSRASSPNGWRRRRRSVG